MFILGELLSSALNIQGMHFITSCDISKCSNWIESEKKGKLCPSASLTPPEEEDFSTFGGRNVVRLRCWFPKLKPGWKLKVTVCFPSDLVAHWARSLWAFWYRKHLAAHSKSINANDTNTVENTMASWWLPLPRRIAAEDAALCSAGLLIQLFSPVWSETISSSFWPLFSCQLLQPCLAVLWYLETTLQVEQMLCYLLGGNLLNKSSIRSGIRN